MIDEIDVNRDGSISFSEFVQLMAKNMNSQGGAQADMNEAFNVFDKDRDGKISQRELIDVMKSLGEDFSEIDADALMKSLDSDKDGFMNKKEFKSLLGF